MVRLGIIGTGGMAQSHARAFSAIKGVELVAACDIDEECARAFASAFSIPHVYTDWNTLLDSGRVNAVTIVAPDALHADMALGALHSGIHVLCEKPLTTSTESAVAMAHGARRSGLVHMVNFSYRRAASLHAARRIVASGALGPLRHVRGEYLQSWLVSDAWGHWATTDAFLWRLSKQHGSLGVLGDVGVHLLDFVAYAAGGEDGGIESLRCSLGTWPKNAAGTVGPYRLDANDSALMEVQFADGAMGVLQASRWTTGHLNTIRMSIHGTQGALRLDLDDDYDALEVCLGADVHAARWRRRAYVARPSIYQTFAGAVSKAVSSGRAPDTMPDFVRGARVQNWLDTCFRSADQQGTLISPPPLAGL